MLRARWVWHVAFDGMARFWHAWLWFVVVGAGWVYRHHVWALEREDFFEQRWAWGAGLIWCGLMLVVIGSGARLLS